MPHRETTKPFIFFFLVLPHGVSSGFVSITLPFVLTRRLFGRYRCVDCRNRCIGQSLAIFVGTDSGSDTHCAPLVSNPALCGSADPIPAGTVSAEPRHRRNVDGDCFYFTSCFHVHRVAGRWFYAAFSAVVLFAIGRGAASTKYAALSSLGNVPVVYMTALDGWVHDRFGTGWMLQTDALSAILFVVVALFVLHKINAESAQGPLSG